MGAIRYYSFHDSPIYLSETQTGDSLISYMIGNINQDIVRHLDNEELRHILELPDDTADKFFNNITIDVSKTFKKKKARLNISPLLENNYYQINLITATKFDCFS
jgi:hypothetical protein